MSKPNEYKAIELWHKSSGSMPYYWRNLQDTAARDNVPLDAIYKDNSGTWRRLGDLPPDHWFHKLMKEQDNAQK